MYLTKLLSYGWQASINLEDGIKMVYKEILDKGLF
jgi:hypothetical protein